MADNDKGVEQGLEDVAKAATEVAEAAADAAAAAAEELVPAAAAGTAPSNCTPLVMNQAPAGIGSAAAVMAGCLVARVNPSK